MEECCEALVSWGLENGATVHADIDLFGASARCHRGITAKSAIAAGQVLLQIPAELSVQSRLEAQPDGPLADFWRGLSQPVSNVLRLTLTLLHELDVQRSSSRWWPYLNMLATTVDVDLPLFWPQNVLEQLKGTAARLNLSQDESREPETFDKMFKEVVLPIMVLGGDLWPESLRRDHRPFLQCLSWVMSRGFCGGLAFALDGSCLPSLEAGVGGKEQGPFLMPLYDLINHSSWAEERSAELSLEDGVFVVRALRDVAAGEELFKSYGEHGDAELLRTYGFVESGEKQNPNNKLLVTQVELLDGCRKALGLPEAAELEAGRLEHLRALGLMQAVYSVPATGVLPSDLFTVVQVLLMAGKEFEEFKSSDLRVLGRKFHTRGTLHGSKVAACLLMVLARTRQRYGEDAASGAGGAGSDGRVELCAKVRAGELAVLKAAQSHVITSLAPAEGRSRGVGKKRLAATSARGHAKAKKGKSDEAQQTCGSSSGAAPEGPGEQA